MEDVFLLRRSIAHCHQAFCDLLESFFGTQGSTPLFAAQWRRFLRCCMADSMYDGCSLEQLYREYYEAPRRMFDRQPWSGMKVLVTTTADTPVVLTNYKVDVARPAACGRPPHHAVPVDGPDRSWFADIGQGTDNSKRRPRTRNFRSGSGKQWPSHRPHRPSHGYCGAEFCGVLRSSAEFR